MNPQEELNQLRERQEALHQELKERKKELLEAQRLRKDTLKRQIQRAQSRISAAQRKRRTRRLILMGSYLEHVPGDDPDKRDRLIKGLDVCHALRHRPDHIVVGEVRGGEAADLLQALNTGHGGSLTTVHANNATSALSRIASCAMQGGGELPWD